MLTHLLEMLELRVAAEAALLLTRSRVFEADIVTGRDTLSPSNVVKNLYLPRLHQD